MRWTLNRLQLASHDIPIPSPSFFSKAFVSGRISYSRIYRPHGLNSNRRMRTAQRMDLTPSPIAETQSRNLRRKFKSEGIHSMSSSTTKTSDLAPQHLSTSILIKSKLYSIWRTDCVRNCVTFDLPLPDWIASNRSMPSWTIQMVTVWLQGDYDQLA